MSRTPHLPCGVIPPHILTKVAEQADGEARDHRRATLEQMRKLATDRSLLVRPAAAALAPAAVKPRKLRNAYDAKHRQRLPRKLVMNEIKPHSHDVEAQEAFDGSGETFDFFAACFDRGSINGRGLCLDSTVHYATRFDNAMCNGRQMVYGDGEVFNRFTAALDVIGPRADPRRHAVLGGPRLLGADGRSQRAAAADLRREEPLAEETFIALLEYAREYAFDGPKDDVRREEATPAVRDCLANREVAPWRAPRPRP